MTASALRAVPFRTEDAERWDDFVERSVNGTFLHTRRYLGYHGDRFADASLLIHDGDDRLVAVLPAAVRPGSPDAVSSHPGITYGGLVVGPGFTGAPVEAALEAAATAFVARGWRRLLYKAVPAIYHRAPAEDDRFALARIGARLVSVDLSAAIDLPRRPPRPSSLARKIAKATRAGVEVRRSSDDLPAFWRILTDALRQHGVTPVHELAEMRDLMQRFPDEIELVTATHGEAVLAGTVLYRTPMVVHAQYGAVSRAGRELAAGDLLDDAVIDTAAADGVRYFDFGISNERDGPLNDGLHGYKAKFGAGGVVYTAWELDLTAAAGSAGRD